MPSEPNPTRPPSPSVCPYCRTRNADGARRCATCDRALFTAADVVEGDLVGPGGRYEIQEFLGRGGWGMVFKAFDRKLEEAAALKILRHSSEIGPTAEKDEKRFRAEIRLARKVRHPNVCAIHEYGEDGALRYIAMEYIDGTDLRKLLRKEGRLPPTQAFEVALGAAAGLEAVHHAGVVHRDLKPDNIMFDARGIPRLMDFGIAKPIAADATKLTATMAIVGTPWYMSPEQTRGEALDARSDVYSFGIVLFELFTGEVPFGSGDLVEIIVMHRTAPPPLRGPKAIGLPDALVPILDKALAKAPGGRYGSIHELRMDLVQAAASAAVVAPTLTSPATADAPGTGRLGVTATPEPFGATQTAHGLPIHDPAGGPTATQPPTLRPPETVLLRAEPAMDTRVLARPRPAWVAFAGTIAAVLVGLGLWRGSGGSGSPSPPAVTNPGGSALPSRLGASPAPAPPSSPDATSRVARGGDAIRPEASRPSQEPARTPRPEAPTSTSQAATVPPTTLAAAPIDPPSPLATPPSPVPTVPPQAEPPPPTRPAFEPFPLPGGQVPDGWQAPVPLPGNPRPTYRREDVSKDLKGRKVSVLMSVVVSATGQVEDVAIHKGDEPFVMAAVDAIRRWRFKPATYQGEARPVKILVNVVVEEAR